MIVKNWQAVAQQIIFDTYFKEHNPQKVTAGEVSCSDLVMCPDIISCVGGKTIVFRENMFVITLRASIISKYLLKVFNMYLICRLERVWLIEFQDKVAESQSTLWNYGKFRILLWTSRSHESEGVTSAIIEAAWGLEGSSKKLKSVNFSLWAVRHFYYFYHGSWPRMSFYLGATQAFWGGDGGGCGVTMDILLLFERSNTWG